MRLGYVFLTATAVIVLVLARCGSDSSTASNALSKAMGAIAVTSPAASSSSSSASLFGVKKTVTAFMQFAGFHLLMKMMGLSEAADETSAPTTVKPLSEMKSDIQNATTADPATTAAALGNPVEKKSFVAPCYGPSWKDDAFQSNYDRPSGDLGIVYATASNTDTRACAAAQVDALIAGAPSFFNNFIKMQAVMLAAANKSSKSLPAEGQTEDLTTLMPSITGLTVTNADLKRVDTTDDTEMYKTIFDFTSSSKSGNVTIFHKPKNADNTNFEGLAYATVPHFSGMGTGDKRFMSMVYSQADGVLKISAKIMANRNTNSTDAFTTGYEVDFSKSTSDREDFHWILAEFNSSNGAGTLHYAWQAGAEGVTRTFAFTVPSGGETATAFAGFGPGMGSSGLVASATPWTQKFHCNWKNGVANSASIQYVQKQTMTKSSGKFLPSASNIAFAPTDSCNRNSTWVVSGASASFLNGTKQAVTNDLVTPPTSSDIPAVAAPTFTIPSGG